jgi:hypothetical protein
MTAQHDLERLITAFLADGPAEMSDRNCDAVRAAIDRTHQRTVVGPWRIATVPTFAKLAAGMAAVIVFSFIGFNLLGGGPFAGNGQFAGSASSPTPVPTPAETTTPAPSPTATRSPTTSLRPGELPGGNTILAAGDYAFYGTGDARTMRVGFTAPEGWLGRGWYIASPEDVADATGQAAFAPWELDQATGSISAVYSDPCDATSSSAVGPAVADLVTALIAQQRRAGVQTSDITVSGYTGVEVVSSFEDAPAGCGTMNLWSLESGQRRYVPEPGLTQVLWILDVDGSRLVLEGSWYADTPPATRAQLDDVMSSIEITVE